MWTHTRDTTLWRDVTLPFPLGAHALHHADNYLGELFRRLKRKLGKPEAVTATAHKLARIVFHLLPESDGNPISYLARARVQHLPSADLFFRTQAKPRGKRRSVSET